MLNVKKKIIMRLLILIILTTFFISCKAKQFKEYSKSNITIEDTMFKNSKSKLNTINSIFNSIEHSKTTLIMLNGRKMTYDKFIKNYSKKVDSTYTFEIIKERNELDKLKVKTKYENLILINKSS